MEYPDTSPALAVALRPGHVLRISDIDGLALDDLVDSVSTDLPVFLDYRGPADRSARDVVTEVLDALESIVLALFPTWLPGHHAGELLDADDAEAAARRLCRDAALTSTAVVHLARVAAGAPSTGSPPGSEALAVALTFLLRRSYHRDTVVLAVRASPDLPARAQQAAAAACRWIADHGRVAVWLTSDALLMVPWVPEIRIGARHIGHPNLPTPDSPGDESVDRVAGPPLLAVSRPTGSPAPHSTAEQALERVLAHQAWARDRQWNRSPRDLDPLSPAVVVDLLWVQAKVVVEVDGADHRGPVKYARDRRRDNMLQRAGYLVLRFTNEQVLDDATLVAAELAAVLAERTRPTGERGASPVPPPPIPEESSWITPG
ncbi:endonuclease domain-containing protein [Gordonia amicalis]|nr:endonuclease domain-containing protein [Gordonia amicalis]